MSAERIQLDILFDEKGNLRQGMKGDVLFDEKGYVSGPMDGAVRQRMVDNMPLAHTDLARLFYAIVAQDKTERKISAKFFWK